MTPEASPAITTVPEWTPTRMAGAMSWRRCQLNAGVLHPLDQPQRGQDRPPGVVLVGDRVPEAGHDAVALELQHAPAQLLDGLRRHPAVEDEDVLNHLGLGHLGHVGRLDDVGEDQADEGTLAPGQGTLQRGPLEHRGGPLVRRVDGQHVVGQLDNAVPGSDGGGGVHGRQEPIDQQRQALLRRRRRHVVRRGHRARPLTSPRGLGVAHVEERWGLLAARPCHERSLVQAGGHVGGVRLDGDVGPARLVDHRRGDRDVGRLDGGGRRPATRVRSVMLTRAPSERALTMSVVCSTVRAVRPGSAPAVGRTVTSAQFEMLSMPVCQAAATSPGPGAGRAGWSRWPGLPARNGPTRPAR